MATWTFYPLFLGATVSIIALSRFAITQRANLKTRTLSELATTEEKLLVRFRNILLFCGPLFAITMFGFIVPRAPHPLPVFVLSLGIIIGEILAGAIPAHKGTRKIHESLAGLMGVSMLILPYVFWFSFEVGYRVGEAGLAIFMTILAVLLMSDTYRKNFVVNELLFIFASHISIVLAALAVRS